MSTTPEATPEATPAATPAATPHERYAAYDDKYLRYVPGVHDTKAKAAKAAKAAGVAKFTVREV